MLDTTNRAPAARPDCWSQHAAMKLDPAVWATLEFVGLQITEADDYGPREVLECRNCTCGSTLAVEVAL